MPELPEVEAARLLIVRHCLGKRVTAVSARESGGGPRTGQFDDIVIAGGVTEDAFSRALVGRRLEETLRRGKVQAWRMGGPGPHATWHFGMTGMWAVKGVPGVKLERYGVDSSVWPPKFTKCELTFDDGTRVAFTDPRRLARIHLVGDPLRDPPIADLGPDALLALPEMPAFAASLAARATAVKALLLDQSFLAGVGNWIADEVLYQARVHPESACCALDAEAVRRLHEAIRAVVGLAVAVEADADKFPREWLFHYRWGKGKGASKDAAGRAIEFVTVGGRTSAVVREVQGAPRRAPAGKAAAAAAAGAGTGPAAAGAAAPPQASLSSSASSSSSTSSSSSSSAPAPPKRAPKRRASAAVSAEADSAQPAPAAAADGAKPTARKAARTPGKGRAAAPEQLR
jgi:formamidopyrimidine-DNA glycosylase